MNNRREFLCAAAGGLLWTRLDGQDRPLRTKRDMLVRSVRPEDLEMPLSGFSDYITPFEHFFVRTHVYVPNVKAGEWRLRVEGEVASPLNLSMEELRKLPEVEVVSVLECAGNGRGLYDPPVAGLQWTYGAVGNARWRGVRLADVLKRAGVKSTAVEILFDGADVPLGTMADFQRAIPVKKALDPNTLLAYEMNGEALPAQHGYPLRAIVPGWAGDSWTKWVTTIRVLEKESDGYWMKSAYRRPPRPVTPGAVIPADAMQPVQSIGVKSVISSPMSGAQAEAGKLQTIRGAAWSGESGPVTAVDVSTDAGRSWHAARLTGAATRYGWRLWEFNWTPATEGYYTLLARAKDQSGDSQPFSQEWNPSGYLWNVVARTGVEVVKEPRAISQPVETTANPLPAPPRFRETCVVCHEEDVIRQQRLTRAQWDREINKMAGWTTVNKDDREGILNYLAASYGPRR